MTKDKIPTELADHDLDQANGGDNVARWNFENAWPNKTTRASTGNAVAMEEIVLATEGLELDGDVGETPPLSVAYTLKR